jgi:hypothetical protein
MSVKTFGSEVLTSGDVNTYLANSGLVYVTSATVGTAVASATVSSAFNTDYDAYQIVWSGGTMSADTAIGLSLGATVTGYYGSYVYGSYASAAVAGANDNNNIKFSYIGGGDPFNGATATFTLNNPFLTKQTYVAAIGVAYSSNVGTYTGRLANSTSYTAFTIGPVAGTFTGGTVRVYGYRKA